jgi:hypothetical protein
MMGKRTSATANDRRFATRVPRERPAERAAGRRSARGAGAAAVLASIAAVALLSGPAHGETVVSSNITTSTTWTVGGNPYVIEKSVVQVRFLSTLTIDPGVEVRFQPGTQIATDTGSSIVAVGAVNDTIVFTSNSDTPTSGDWQSVEVSSSPGSVFQYCKFEYAAYGLRLRSPGAATHVYNCAFYACQTSLYLEHASPEVHECWFRYPESYNVLSFYSDSTPDIWHCNFALAGGMNVYLQNYSTPATVDAEFNWWGTANAGFIAATIYDHEDGHGQGTVDFQPFLTEVPVEAASWGRIKALFR